MGLVSLDSGQSVVFLVWVSEFYINYFVRGMLYKWDLLEIPKISKLWGSYHKFHLAHPILIRPVALQRSNIKEILKIKFHTQKGQKLGATTEEILSSRPTSKSRFKSDTWPTCNPKRELLHQISLQKILLGLLMKVNKFIRT